VVAVFEGGGVVAWPPHLNHVPCSPLLCTSILQAACSPFLGISPLLLLGCDTPLFLSPESPRCGKCRRLAWWLCLPWVTTALCSARSTTPVTKATWWGLGGWAGMDASLRFRRGA
jgi:hypothetical protein